MSIYTPKRFNTLTDLRRMYKDMMVDGVIEMTLDEWFWYEQLVTPLKDKNELSFRGVPIKKPI